MTKLTYQGKFAVKNEEKEDLALFCLLPPASVLVGHDGLNAIVMDGFE